MAPIAWRFEAELRAAPDDVYAWMADLRPDDHARPAFLRGAGIDPAKARPAKPRKILAREGNVATVEDEWDGRTFRLTVTMDPKARTVRLQGGFGYDSTWTAGPSPQGTRLRVEGTMGPRGVLSILMLPFRAKTVREMEADFRGHVEDARSELESR